MTKRLLYFSLPILLLFSACKAIKTSETSVKMLSTKKVVKEYEKATFSKKTVEAKIKVHYTDSKISQNLTIKFRLKKDEIIWMSGSFLGLPLAKIKITPTSVQFYEKITRTYFDGDFSLIGEALGTELNFKQLQNILIGQCLQDLDNKYLSQIDDTSYLLTPRIQAELYEVFYWINPLHFKLDKLKLSNQTEKQSLSVAYPSYQNTSKTYFPEIINIIATQPKQTTSINMEFRNVEFDNELRFPFKLPSNYKKIRL